jgi:hypothetical protein
MGNTAALAVAFLPTTCRIAFADDVRTPWIIILRARTLAVE